MRSVLDLASMMRRVAWRCAVDVNQAIIVVLPDGEIVKDFRDEMLHMMKDLWSIKFKRITTFNFQTDSGVTVHLVANERSVRGMTCDVLFVYKHLSNNRQLELMPLLQRKPWFFYSTNI